MMDETAEALVSWADSGLYFIDARWCDQSFKPTPLAEYRWNPEKGRWGQWERKDGQPLPKEYPGQEPGKEWWRR